MVAMESITQQLLKRFLTPKFEGFIGLMLNIYKYMPLMIPEIWQ